MTQQSKIGWAFMKLDGDKTYGFNHSGIETFLGDKEDSLAREVTQNSNDARSDSKRPLLMRFGLIKVNKAEFPNHSEYEDILNLCLPVAKNESPKAEAFFKKALQKINENELDILVIQDSNTRGMEGPSTDKSKGYYSFMKSDGTSVKPSTTSGGSYGIGKNAPFALSDFRTIFVLTRYKDGSGKIRQLVQGKCIFISHGNPENYTNEGYWGIKSGFSPIENDVSEIPSWMTDPFGEGAKTDTGTTIFIVGFNGENKWEQRITGFILQNFFAAIQKDLLIADVAEYKIDSSTITNLFNDKDIRDSLSIYQNQPNNFDLSKEYFECLNNSDSELRTTQQTHLGKTHLKMLLGETYHKKVAFIRNGMLITDKLDKLQRFAGFKNFSAVVECGNQKGNELLKKMEPPAHDNFEPERLDDPLIGRKALRDITDYVKKELEKYAKAVTQPERNVAELASLLGVGDPGDLPAKDGEVNPLGDIKITFKPTKTSQSTNQVGGGTRGQTGGGSGSGGGSGGNKRKTKNVAITNIKGIRLGAKDRKFIFTPMTQSKHIKLEFKRVGVDDNTPMEIDKCPVATTVKKEFIEVSVQNGKEINLPVSFVDDFDGAIKVIANEI